MFLPSDWDVPRAGTFPCFSLAAHPSHLGRGPTIDQTPPHGPSAPLTLSPLSSLSLKNQSDCRGDKRK